MPSKPQQPPKNKNKIKDTSTTTTPTKPTPPNWPPLKPLLPSSTLSLTPLLPNHQILTISHFWTSTLCKAYISFLSSSSSNLTFTTTPSKPKKGEAVRVNDRLQVDDAGFAERLWSGTGLKGLVMGDNGFEGEGDEEKEKDGGLWGGEVLGLSSNIRVYRYGKGQFFGRHYDESNHIMFPSDDSPNAVPAKTTWTFLLYLTSPATGCQGGETVFYPEAVSKREAAPAPVVVNLEVGMALLHRHGKECMLHEGKEVTEGEKWVIRSDVCVKR